MKVYKKLRADLYTELERDNLESLVCAKEQLHETLHQLIHNKGMPADAMIIQVEKGNYRIWYQCEKIQQKDSCIKLDFAIRFRVESELSDLEPTLMDIDESIEAYAFKPVTDKYCLVKYLDLKDDFVILDVFIGVKEK